MAFVPISLATTQQSVVADALTDAGGSWFLSLQNVTAKKGHGSPLSDQSDAEHVIISNYSQPYTAALCLLEPTNNFPSSTHIKVPFLPSANSMNAVTKNITVGSNRGPIAVPLIEHPGITYQDLFALPGNDEEFRVKWIDLPGEQFPGSSIGAAILYPGFRSNGTNNLLVCNLAAVWGASLIAFRTSSGLSETTMSTLKGKTVDNRERKTVGQWGLPVAEQYDPSIITPFHRVQNLHKAIDAINVSASWADYLNPRVGQYNTSLFHAMTEVAPTPLAYHEAQTILAILLANGLARTSWNSTLQGDFKTIGPNGTGKIDGISSNCWDTIAEITVLAINTTPTVALRNICAGISELHIFKLPVRVLVSKDEEGEGEHLELVFGQVDGEKTLERTVVANRTYGTLPRAVQEADKKVV
ncbi:MAG: hypothetical protein Q9195_002542 [Heterodermia aff. obscurata]